MQFDMKTLATLIDVFKIAIKNNYRRSQRLRVTIETHLRVKFWIENLLLYHIH